MSGRQSSSTEPRTRLTRRRIFGVAGGAGAAYLLSGPGVRHLVSVGDDGVAAEAATGCVLTPSKTIGPYFVEEGLVRSDIRTDPSDGTTAAGIPLTIAFQILRADDCSPISGALVDVWHASAKGKYSDEQSEGTAGKKFLRGTQPTGSDGKASFTTVFPGWYSGRAVHIHFRIRLFSGTTQTYDFTSQLFFDPALTSQVMATSAYGRGNPDTPNSSDMIYGSDGSTLVIALTGDTASGYSGTFVAGLTGLPASTTGTTNTVKAALSKLQFRRTSTGRRLLRQTLNVDEAVAVYSKLTRSGRILASKHVSKVAVGNARTVDVAIPNTIAAGTATLTLVLKDGTGTKKTVTRTVKIPKPA